MATRPSPPRVSPSNGQQVLWHDTILDALGSAVQAAGGVKRVAAALWPAADTDTASARLRSGLNPEHAQKICPHELVALVRLAKEQGDHSIMNFLAAELGYAPPVPIEPEDQRAALQREVCEVAKRLEKLLKDLER